jgi:type I restriction enzyme, R subunit
MLFITDAANNESFRAILRVIVKRTVRKFGYLPDMEKLATETVLKQAELIANELTLAM